jgi:hypothetical protein
MSVELVPVLVALAFNSTTSPEESVVWNRRALDIARAEKAPAAALALLSVMPNELVKGDEGRRRHVARLEALLDDPVIAGDAAAVGFIRLALADNWKRRPEQSLPLYRAIVNDPRLEQRHPIRGGLRPAGQCRSQARRPGRGSDSV